MTGAKAAANKQPSSVDPNYKPRRLNKAIELWEDGQPIYYTGWGVHEGVNPYEQGIKMAKTWADAISIEMEHGLFSLRDLREFMRGLRDGGPTASGHKFPATFVTPPVIGLDEPYARANTWMLEQILCTGVTGIHICHARDAKAIATYMYMGSRYPFMDRPNVPKMPMQGLRGNSASYAANIWGVSGGTYQHIADLWPLNPRGEIIFGVKLEDTYSDKAAPEITALPGLAFAEWGPGDHNLWLNGYNAVAEGGLSGHPVIRAFRLDANSSAAYEACLAELGDARIDLVYIDAVHDFWPTMQSAAVYGLWMRARFLVLDDITLNAGMLRAWTSLRSRFGADAVDATEIVPQIRPPSDGTRPGFGFVRLPG